MDGSFAFKFDEMPASAGLTRAFEREVRDFLARELTEDLREAGRQTTGLKSAPEACRQWRGKLRKRGWLAPDWPTEFGGAGWTPEQRQFFEAECAANDAPVLMSSGIRSVGPMLIEAGTPEQQEYYLPRILSGEHEWCQGFSEAQAGSDLPALALKARRDGDHFILDGHKLWTSNTDVSTHMYLLARCEEGSSGRDGIVLLLVRMDSPGLKVRPIQLIDGSCEVSEVFFDGVRTPAGARIGEIGEGWKAARQMMAISRSNNTTSGTLRRAWRMAQTLSRANGGGAEDRAILAGLERDIDAFEAFELRLGDKANGVPGTSSLLKLKATELHQAITLAALQMAPHERLAQAKYFFMRAATIYSGTSEVHRNGLARAIGL